MAAGKPVLASSIPAHRELLTTGLFDPDDDQALSALLDLVTDPAWCAASLGCQASVWPRFRAIAVAQRFWSSVDRLRPVVPPCTPGSRVKVAFLTPLPPDQSGVADYSAAACRELGANTELHLFSPTAQAKTPEGATTVSPLSLYPFLSSKFDRVVAVLGNSVFHIDILRMVLRYGGAVILHDGRMLDLYAGHIDFEKTVTMAERELGRPLRPNEIWSWLAGDTAPEALILSEVAGVAEPLMMHSRTAIADVGRRYGKEAIHLPFSLQRTIGEQHLTPDGRLTARKRLAVPETEVLIATFGYVHPTKAPLECLWALVLLRSWGINARLHFVGASIMPLDALDKTIADRGLAEHVRMPTEFVDEETYRDHLVGADVALQLRYGSTGSVSGSVSDCIAAGLRTVASAGLANAVDAPDFVVRVSDNPSPVLVAEAIAASLNYRDTTRERLGYIKAHGFDSYTNKLCIALNIR
jgi:glycosyltransferase involved in cell wall biosynthesis